MYLQFRHDIHVYHYSDHKIVRFEIKKLNIELGLRYFCFAWTLRCTSMLEQCTPKVLLCNTVCGSFDSEVQYWLSGEVPRLPSYGVYIYQLLRFVICCTSVSDLNSKNLQLTSKLLTQGYRYHKLRKTFGKFFRSYSDLLSKCGEISFQEYVTEAISHPVFFVDLVYKLRRISCEANFVSSGSKIVKRHRHRKSKI